MRVEPLGMKHRDLDRQNLETIYMHDKRDT